MPESQPVPWYRSMGSTGSSFRFYRIGLFIPTFLIHTPAPQLFNVLCLLSPFGLLLLYILKASLLLTIRRPCWRLKSHLVSVAVRKVPG